MKQEQTDAMERAFEAVGGPEVSMPLCEGHARIDKRGMLVLEVGNNCVACSLNERTELLVMLAPFIPEGGADSVATLQTVLSGYAAALEAGKAVDENGLKPCPFCGSRAAIHRFDDMDIVECDACPAQMSSFALWNRRVL
jgi:hypothetical protein